MFSPSSFFSHDSLSQEKQNDPHQTGKGRSNRKRPLPDRQRSCLQRNVANKAGDFSRNDDFAAKKLLPFGEYYLVLLY
jgi:hypothetical protein